MAKIKVAVWGFGNMGKGIIKGILKKNSMQLTGVVVDFEKELIGKDPADVLGVGKSKAKIYGSLKDLVKKAKPEVVIQATASFMKQVEPGIKQIVENKMHCVTIAEEGAFPWANAKPIANRLDKLAKKHKVSIVGTGINPGLVLDTLVVTLTGCCLDIEMIEASRINDLSPFGATVMKTQGVGSTVDEFNKGIADGSIVGHIGFPESLNIIANALGWKIEKIEETREPIISDVYRETPCVKVKPGMVAGCRHTATAYVGGKPKIKLIHPQQIHPHLANVKTGDYVKITGTPNVNVSNIPEIPGGIGTMAMAVNVVPLIVKATPGFKTMADLSCVHMAP